MTQASKPSSNDKIVAFEPFAWPEIQSYAGPISDSSRHMEASMPIRYEHTQRGTFMIVTLLISALVIAAIAYTNTGLARWISTAGALGMVILAWLFSSLTAIVNDDEVRWYFGPGAWRYQIPLTDIEAAHVVRNSWLNGFGIRVGRGFRLYNVSGLDAVELQLKDGEVRRIGTDDAAGLVTALQRD
jgi:hypothetical protein